VSAVRSKSGGKAGKKPQMKYDPDIPMTKEEAAVWRREQRRKRNRESAAASRQRQRDRIDVLEGEVDEWKKKYDDVMAKVRALEQVTGCVSSPPDDLEVSSSSRDGSCTTPPPTDPVELTARVSPELSKSLSSSLKVPAAAAAGVEEFLGAPFVVKEEDEDTEGVVLPSKMISRPA